MPEYTSLIGLGLALTTIGLVARHYRSRDRKKEAASETLLPAYQTTLDTAASTSPDGQAETRAARPAS
jgi:hypothetical protein